MKLDMQNQTCRCGGSISLVQEYRQYAKLYHCNKCQFYEIIFKECSHEFTTYKIRYGGDKIHVVTKCRLCGSHWKTHKKADFNLNQLEYYDEKIEKSYYGKHMRAKEKLLSTHAQIVLEQKKLNNTWNIEQWYYGYLESDMWRRKREFILNRAKGNCERCGGKANYVHHKTYKRVGYELPEDLIGL